jgi:hypothetical protein
MPAGDDRAFCAGAADALAGLPVQAVDAAGGLLRDAADGTGPVPPGS